VLFQVAAALGLAWGWSTVLEGAGKARDRRLTRVMTVVAVVAAAGLIAGLAGPDLWRASYVAWAERARSAAGQQYSPELAAFAYQGFIGDLMRVSLLGLAAAALGMLALRGKLPASVATLGVLALLMIELWPVSGRVMQPVIGDPVRRNLELGRDDVIDFLEKAGSPGTFRILPLQEFQNNRFAGFGIASLGGYHAAKPRLYQDFYETVLSRDLNLSWLRLLNVRYIVSRGALQPLPPYLREVHSGSAFVYENLVALPRATVVGRYRVIAPARAILDSVMAGTSESSEVTFLEQDPHLQLGPVTGARAEILSYGLNQVTVEVETPGPALLRLADLWYPYWTATVDDRDEPVLKADYLLRAVAVPAGRHRVVFRYQSPAIRRGLLLTGASLVVILLLFAVPPLVRRRVRPRSGEGPPTREGA
jgi:hypothetical protein